MCALCKHIFIGYCAEHEYAYIHTHALGIGRAPTAVFLFAYTKRKTVPLQSPTVPFHVSCSNTNVVAPCPMARWGGGLGTHGVTGCTLQNYTQCNFEYMTGFCLSCRLQKVHAWTFCTKKSVAGGTGTPNALPISISAVLAIIRDR